MAQTIGSLDLNAFSDLYSDSTQYFWFESNASATYGAGVHITLSPDTSFISNPTGQNILMNTDGISIRNGLLPMMVLDNDSLDFNVVDTTEGTYTNVASFGASSTIGVTNNTQSYMALDYHSIQAIDGSVSYFHVSNLLDRNGYITDKYEGDGSTVAFTLSLQAANTSYQVFVDDVEIGGGYVNKQQTQFILGSAPSSGSIIKAIYTPYDATNPYAYTLGIRKSNTLIGKCSVVEGLDNVASGIQSHAEGYSTIASGMHSHAEGNGTKATSAGAHAEGGNTTASGHPSHAEGYTTIASGIGSHSEGANTSASNDYAHAEGLRTYASGQNSHSEGRDSTASGTGAHVEGYLSQATGNYSHAQNRGGLAASNDQTAIGRYNIGDANNEYALIIGNGTSVNARNNALTIDWNGGIQMYIDSDGTSSSAATSGTDMDLFNAIYDLGWYSDVIV